MNSRSTASRISSSRLLNSSGWQTSPQDDEWSRHQVTSDNDRAREEDENRKEKTDKGYKISFFCDKVALHYRNDDDKKNQDCGPHHERQNETLSCVQDIKV